MQRAVGIADIEIAAARGSNIIALMQDPTEAHRLNPPEPHCSFPIADAYLELHQRVERWARQSSAARPGPYSESWHR